MRISAYTPRPKIEAHYAGVTHSRKMAKMKSAPRQQLEQAELPSTHLQPHVRPISSLVVRQIFTAHLYRTADYA
jgi:hypothetical protein